MLAFYLSTVVRIVWKELHTIEVLDRFMHTARVYRLSMKEE
jgi:hypothetical protein